MRGPRLFMRLRQEPFVVPHHQLAVDLLHRLECHAHGDQERGTPEWELLNVPQREHEQRRDRDRREEERTGKGDAVEHLREIALGLWSRTDTRDESTLLSDDVGLLLR